LSVWYGNGSQLLSDNDGGNSHVTCAKPKINQLPRTVIHGLGAGTVVQDDEGFLSLREIHEKFKILLQVVLSAGNDKQTVILLNEILVVGPIPNDRWDKLKMCFQIVEKTWFSIPGKGSVSFTGCHTYDNHVKWHFIFRLNKNGMLVHKT
jgi:hypothetical protein